MIAEADQIHLVPVSDINILNPRARSKKAFAELVESISKLGLKRPVTVSQREDGRYDLVCGQGRLEAFMELRQEKIPAVVIKVSQEDCYVMSLVENLARRQRSPAETLSEFVVLKARGYGDAEIARKTGFSAAYVYAILHLLENGEERLLAAVERGVVPHSIALEIARAKDVDVQAALVEAYEKKAMPGSQVAAIRAIVDQRNRLGKGSALPAGRRGPRSKVTSSALISTYRKETERQKALARKASVAEERLAFVTAALRKLLLDERFPLLLKAEQLQSLPKPLSDRLHAVEV